MALVLAWGPLWKGFGVILSQAIHTEVLLFFEIQYVRILLPDVKMLFKTADTHRFIAFFLIQPVFTSLIPDVKMKILDFKALPPVLVLVYPENASQNYESLFLFLHT